MADAPAKRIRTCIGCNERSGKVGLHRIVRTPDGSVAYDPTGRKAGRGAYVCSPRCLESALKARKVQRALRCNVSDADMADIVASIAAACEAAAIKE